MLRKSFTSVWLIAFLMFFSFFPFSNGVGAEGTLQTTNADPLADLIGEIDVTTNEITSVIVELTEPSVIEAKSEGEVQTQSNLSNARQQVQTDISDVIDDAQFLHEFEHVFSGFSMELKAEEVPVLLNVPGIKAVYPNITYTTTTVGEPEFIAEDAYSPLMNESAPHIGADLVWETGLTGEGVTVAIIDTGVDYTHPDLEGAFGDYKGWDFVDNDDDPQETPPNDPRGDETNHGTHVAGTVAANGLIKGVAPDATLLAYRVLGPGGSGSSDNVIAAIERSVLDGADIMNLSLGNSLNNPDFATSIALDWAMSEGVVAVTSNGNSGPNNWTVGSPGTSREALSVGATQLPYNLYHVEFDTLGDFSYPSAKVMGSPSDDELLELDGETYEFVDVGFGAPEEFDGKDVEGKVALISRGAGIAFVDKATAAKDAGAVAAVMYNNAAGEIVMVPGTDIPTFRITAEDGANLLEELENGLNEITFQLEYDSTVGETMADFSSRGPVTDTWMIKPDVSAPGVNIRSTVPTHNPENPHGYAAMQGTSMASPHAAGAAALILQDNPDWSVERVKAALMNTAETLVNPDTNSRYPHNTQGAGSIRIVNSLETNTLVTPGSHSFGTFLKEKGKQVERQHFTIRNLSSERIAYNFDVEIENGGKAIKVMTSNNLRVNPGKSQKVNMNVQVDASKLDPGYYEGTITISGGNETVEVPTILFVKEPDYPRVANPFLTQLGLDVYEIGGSLPGGAEIVDIFIYHSNAGQEPLEYIGDIAHLTDVSSGYNPIYEWDRTVNGERLEAGYYNIYIYATKEGKSDLAGMNVQLR
nr:S8 family serine peptidase [Alkalihalobacillus trypoxylicola]